MTVTMEDLVAEARSRVAAISPKLAEEAARQGDLILDVREPAELEKDGHIAGALHVPRGIVETRADATAETAEARLTELCDSRRVHVLCASAAAPRWPQIRSGGWAMTPILSRAVSAGGNPPVSRSRADPWAGSSDTFPFSTGGAATTGGRCSATGSPPQS